MRLSSFVLFGGLILFSLTPAFSARGVANIAGTGEDSVLSGQLKFEDTKDGLHITGTIEKISSGDHGFHIHEYGDCSNEGKSAGSHYNPDSKPHGLAMKEGVKKVHPGDLGNLDVDENGTAAVDITLPGLSLSEGKYNVAGRAVIIHEKKDDFGQPTGNAGGRIGCGTIVLTGQ